MGVPSGIDAVIFNTNRNYGRIMNSHLFANWDVIYSELLEHDINLDNVDEISKTVEDLCGDAKRNIFWCFQPMTIVEKPHLLTKNEL